LGPALPQYRQLAARQQCSSRSNRGLRLPLSPLGLPRAARSGSHGVSAAAAFRGRREGQRSHWKGFGLAWGGTRAFRACHFRCPSDARYHRSSRDRRDGVGCGTQACRAHNRCSRAGKRCCKAASAAAAAEGRNVDLRHFCSGERRPWDRCGGAEGGTRAYRAHNHRARAMARYIANAAPSACAARCNDVVRHTSTANADAGFTRCNDVVLRVPTANAYIDSADCNVNLRSDTVTSTTVGVIGCTSILQHYEPSSTAAKTGRNCRPGGG